MKKTRKRKTLSEEILKIDNSNIIENSKVDNLKLKLLKLEEDISEKLINYML